jgi:serine/threonine-protein kinase
MDGKVSTDRNRARTVQAFVTSQAVSLPPRKSSMRPQVGQVINNKYRLIRLIGDGGMGSVYEARHEVLGTSVALKFLHQELTRRSGLVQRFLQEARVSAQIQSPHVVRVHDVDQAYGGAFIVMEYLEGRTLQALYEELYRASQKLSYADALEYAMQMLEGVEAAHKHNIVHRDLKPDNVMITTDPKGRPLLKLLDFGIAKLKVEGDFKPGLTRPGVIMGTPEYMAPEQAYSADAVDARADIFALGVLVFEMLAGRRPVGGDDPQQIATSYLTGRVAHLSQLAPQVAPELAAAIHRAMAPMARDRYENVTELRDAIEPFAAAVKAPSAMPHTGSFSLPGLSRAASSPSGATPPATDVSAVGGRAVPKTLPPIDEPPAAVRLEATAAYVEPPRARGVDATVAFVEPPAADTNPAEPPAMSSQDGPTAAYVPPTRSVQPYVPAAAPAADPAATAFAAPLAPYIPSRPSLPSPPAPEMSPRASGTAVGDAFYAGATPAEVAPPPYAPPPYAPPMLAPVMPAPAPARGKPRPGGLAKALPAILLLATGAAGAVVGGAYLLQRTSSDDKDDPPVSSAPATTVQADPPASDPPVSPPANPPAKPQVLPPSATIRPKPGFTPPPRGSGTAPAPTTPPKPDPGYPVIIIPSSLPFPFFSEPPRQQPQRAPDPPRQRRQPPPGDPDGP